MTTTPVYGDQLKRDDQLRIHATDGKRADLATDLGTRSYWVLSVTGPDDNQPDTYDIRYSDTKGGPEDGGITLRTDETIDRVVELS